MSAEAGGISVCAETQSPRRRHVSRTHDVPEALHPAVSLSSLHPPDSQSNPYGGLFEAVPVCSLYRPAPLRTLKASTAARCRSPGAECSSVGAGLCTSSSSGCLKIRAGRTGRTGKVMAVTGRARFRPWRALRITRAAICYIVPATEDAARSRIEPAV